MNLANGHPINLPVLLETRLLVQAGSGGGKSWALRRILEQTAPHVQQLVIDPEGEFATLREKFDYVIAAAHDADAVASPQTAPLLARRLMESGVSAILDIYDLKHHERVLFVRRFLEALVNAPRKLWHPVLVVLDEAHVFCPQAGSAESASAVIDIATRGRKRGLCAVLATQRLSKLHKDAAAEMQNKLIGLIGLDVDVKRAADELGLSPRDALQTLRALDSGQFYAFGPALTRAPELVKIGPVVTTHPKAGQRLLQAPPPASPKVREELAKLADLQKDADQEARTIEELKAENAKLRREAAAAKRGNATAEVQGMADCMAMVRDECVKAKVFPKSLAPMFYPEAIIALHAKATTQIRGDEHAALQSIVRIANETLVASHPIPRGAVDPRALATATRGKAMQSPTPPSFAGLETREEVIAKPGTLSGPAQRILDAIAWMESIGVEQPSQAAVAFLAGYSGASNSAYKNPRAALKTAGLLQYLADASRIALTDAGREKANQPRKAATREELHQRVMAKLGGPEQRILQPLLDRYPAGVSNAELAVAASYSDESNSAYKNPRARLRTFGLVEYRDGGVRAADFLFPQGATHG